MTYFGEKEKKWSFFAFFLFFIIFHQNFQTQKNAFFNRPRVEYFGQMKSRYLKNCVHSSCQIQHNNTYIIPTEYRNHLLNCESAVGSDWQAERRSVMRGVTTGGLVSVSTDDQMVSTWLPFNSPCLKMFLGQLGGKLWSKTEIWQPCSTKCCNPVDRTDSKLLPFDFPCSKT